MKTVELLFWIALLLVFYTYLGYGQIGRASCRERV